MSTNQFVSPRTKKWNNSSWSNRSPLTSRHDTIDSELFGGERQATEHIDANVLCSDKQRKCQGNHCHSVCPVERQSDEMREKNTVTMKRTVEWVWIIPEDAFYCLPL